MSSNNKDDFDLKEHIQLEEFLRERAPSVPEEKPGERKAVWKTLQSRMEKRSHPWGLAASILIALGALTIGIQKNSESRSGSVESFVVESYSPWEYEEAVFENSLFQEDEYALYFE